jgi:hypothetical protein
MIREEIVQYWVEDYVQGCTRLLSSVEGQVGQKMKISLHQRKMRMGRCFIDVRNVKQK